MCVVYSKEERGLYAGNFWRVFDKGFRRGGGTENVLKVHKGLNRSCGIDDRFSGGEKGGVHVQQFNTYTSV